MRRSIVALLVGWAVLFLFLYVRSAHGRELPREDPHEVLP